MSSGDDDYGNPEREAEHKRSMEAMEQDKPTIGVWMDDEGRLKTRTIEIARAFFTDNENGKRIFGNVAFTARAVEGGGTPEENARASKLIDELAGFVREFIIRTIGNSTGTQDVAVEMTKEPRP